MKRINFAVDDMLISATEYLRETRKAGPFDSVTDWLINREPQLLESLHILQLARERVFADIEDDLRVVNAFAMSALGKKLDK